MYRIIVNIAYVFRAFNFRTSQAVRKYFNNEIFAIYGNKLINFIGRGGLAITMVTQYDIERVKNIESNISKYFYQHTYHHYGSLLL